MNNRRLILFSEQNFHSGTFKLEFKIADPDNGNNIKVAGDSNFDFPGAPAIHWLPWGDGSTVNVVSHELHVHKGCKLTGADYFIPMLSNSWYLLNLDITGFTADKTVYISGNNGQILAQLNGPGGLDKKFYVRPDSVINELRISIFPVENDFVVDNFSIYKYDPADIVKWEPYTFGNDNIKDDQLMYPSSFSLTFRPITAFKNVLEIDKKIDELNSLLSIADASIEIFKKVPDGPNVSTFHWQSRYKAAVDKDDINLKYDERTITVRSLDGLARLKNKRFVTGLGYYDRYLLKDYIGIRINQPELNVVKTVEFVADNKVLKMDNTEVDAKDCYLNLKAVEHKDNPYSNEADVLRAILNNLCAYGIPGFDNKYYIMPRMYDGSVCEKLYLNELIPEDLKMKRYEGINANENNNSGSYVIDNEQDDFREINFPFPLSYNDSTNLILNIGRNADFSAGGSDWTNGIVEGGSFQTGGNETRLNIAFMNPFLAGHRYRVKFDITPSSPVRVGLWTIVEEQQIGYTDNFGKEIVFEFTAANNDSGLLFWWGTAATMVFDNITVQDMDAEALSLFANADGTEKIKCFSARQKWGDGTYTARDSFVNLFKTVFAQSYQSVPHGYKVKAKGTEYPVNKFYQIYFSRTNQQRVFPYVFRAQKVVYDEPGNMTQLSLVKCWRIW